MGGFDMLIAGLRKFAGPVVVAGMVGLVAAGCANNAQLLATSSLDANGGAGASSNASAFALASTPKAKPFNPFEDPHAQDYGARQVIAQPTLEEVMKVGALPDMALGRADAPVTVVKYASLTCPHCKRFQATVFPKFKRNYIDTGKVRFVIREFPIGRSSGNATIALRCAPKSAYFKLYGKFLAQQGRWVSQEVRLDNIYAVAKQVGLSRSQFDACLANQDLIKSLAWVKDRGRTLGIIGTPNFFIQNKLVKKVLDYEGLAALVDAELNARKQMAVAN
ncbi:MAG: DsbA family protein [Filomicrobium sp.]